MNVTFLAKTEHNYVGSHHFKINHLTFYGLKISTKCLVWSVRILVIRNFIYLFWSLSNLEPTMTTAYDYTTC